MTPGVFVPDALGIHRNSLRYRLDKIAAITGCDPYRTDEVFRIYLGVQMVAPAG